MKPARTDLPWKVKLAIDLDNTLLTWEGSGTECGVWIGDSKTVLEALIRGGYGVIIHTCRATWDAGGGLEGVLAFLRQEGFDPEVLTSSWDWQGSLGVWVGEGKPVASAYIDDRAVSFQGDWVDTLSKASELLP